MQKINLNKDIYQTLTRAIKEIKTALPMLRHEPLGDDDSNKLIDLMNELITIKDGYEGE